MSDRGPNIDWIVGEVVRRLTETTDAPSARQESAPGVLTVPERLVTLATLDGWLAGVRQVVLRPDAVVTPAVKDELRRRKIAVARGAGSTQPGPMRVNLFVAEGEFAGQFGQALATGAAAVADVLRLSGQKLPAAAAELAQRLTCPWGRGLLLTGKPAAAVVLANRHGGLRAATANSVAALTEAVETIGVNVLAVDPQRVKPEEFAAMICALVAGGRRECPAEFRPALVGA